MRRSPALQSYLASVDCVFAMGGAPNGVSLSLRRHAGIITNGSLLQTTGAVSFRRVLGGRGTRAPGTGTLLSLYRVSIHRRATSSRKSSGGSHGHETAGRPAAGGILASAARHVPHPGRTRGRGAARLRH